MISLLSEPLFLFFLSHVVIFSFENSRFIWVWAVRLQSLLSARLSRNKRLILAGAERRRSEENRSVTLCSAAGNDVSHVFGPIFETEKKRNSAFF